MSTSIAYKYYTLLSVPHRVNFVRAQFLLEKHLTLPKEEQVELNTLQMERYIKSVACNYYFKWILEYSHLPNGFPKGDGGCWCNSTAAWGMSSQPIENWHTNPIHFSTTEFPTNLYSCPNSQQKNKQEQNSKSLPCGHVCLLGFFNRSLHLTK